MSKVWNWYCKWAQRNNNEKPNWTNIHIGSLIENELWKICTNQNRTAKTKTKQKKLCGKQKLLLWQKCGIFFFVAVVFKLTNMQNVQCVRSTPSSYILDYSLYVKMKHIIAVIQKIGVKTEYERRDKQRRPFNNKNVLIRLQLNELTETQSYGLMFSCLIGTKCVTCKRAFSIRELFVGFVLIQHFLRRPFYFVVAVVILHTETLIDSYTWSNSIDCMSICSYDTAVCSNAIWAMNMRDARDSNWICFHQWAHASMLRLFMIGYALRSRHMGCISGNIPLITWPHDIQAAERGLLPYRSLSFQYTLYYFFFGPNAGKWIQSCNICHNNLHTAACWDTQRSSLFAIHNRHNRHSHRSPIDHTYTCEA